MDLLPEIFRDSIFQSMILSPIMGLIFAALFAGLNKRPASTAPATILRTKEIYVTKVIERRGREANDGDEGVAILAGAVIGLFFLVWKYSIYVDAIHYYIGFFLVTAISFSICSMILSYWKGQFTSDEWWFYIISPFLILLFCIFLLSLAGSSFSPKITEIASEKNLVEFFTSGLTEYGRVFVIAHVAGIVFMCLASLFATLALLHYLSLMNQRSAGPVSTVWFYLTKAASLFSKRGWLVTSFVFLILALVGIHPSGAAYWITEIR